MDKYISAMDSYSKIFLGDTDSYTIIHNGFTENNLLYKIKIATLMNDVVLIPAAYMWQSELMKNIMYKIQPLILTENVLPVIRKNKETRDIKDYFEKRRSETSILKHLDVFKIPSLASEIANSKNIRDVEFLNGLNTCIHLDRISVKEKFIDLWQLDLKAISEINSISTLLYQSQLSVYEHDELLLDLKNNVDYNNFSRSTLIDYVLKLDLSNNIKELIQSRISWLYLNANAQAAFSEFYLSNSSNNNLVYASNLELHSKLLSVFGLNEKLIQTISIEDLLRIKYSTEFQRFLVTYNELLQNIYWEQNDIIEMVINKINSQIIKEEIKSKVFGNLPIMFSVSSTIFLGLIINYFSSSVIDFGALAVTGGVSAVSGILSTIDKINNFSTKTSFKNFKEYIIKEEYKNRLLTSINGVIL